MPVVLEVEDWFCWSGYKFWPVLRKWRKIEESDHRTHFHFLQCTYISICFSYLTYNNNLLKSFVLMFNVIHIICVLTGYAAESWVIKMHSSMHLHYGYSFLANFTTNLSMVLFKWFINHIEYLVGNAASLI